MGNSLKLFKVTLVSILILSLLVGCMSKAQKEAIYIRAVPIAKEYMKDNYNIDVTILSNYEIHDPANSVIVLYGHMVDDSGATFTISINHKTYEVSSISVAKIIKEKKVERELNDVL
ncbi:hypothetical protein [Paenibacillus sp. DYY-L-2]|uniref:hypothetical protein n=1 Tax=Paenibacillus sp. DYY-L-2 TaxID=3447013 RepID=UPI003F509B66